MKVLYVKLIFICQSSVSYVKYMFCTPRFDMGNFEPVHFTYELDVSYVKTFPFHLWNETYMCENIPIPYVVHT